MKLKFTFLTLAIISFFGMFAQPTVPATDPTHASSDVLSVYSDVYTNLAGTDFFPNWGQSTVVADFPIGTNNTKRMTTFNYQGIIPAATINLTAASMQNLHIDLWSPAAPDPANASSVKVFLINPGPVEYGVTLNLVPGWNSFDIPLSTYSSNGVNLSNVFQIKLESVPFFYPNGTTTVYYDNFYFWKTANAPTLSNFSIPAQLTGAGPVTITAPTSNSTGAFTYTSSNTNVATISGNTLTVVGAGTSTITATQAPAGAYGQGVITTLLTVTAAPPTVAAPTPTASSANVISVYSDAYTDVAGTDFFPNWGQSTVVADFPISGNANKRLTNFNYQGVQFAAPINASTMEKLHIDLWSSDCTTFQFFLVNTSPATVEQKVDLTPLNAGWNSFDIPLSSFTAINLANIGQFKFVSVPFGGTTVYYDNIYFWKAANAPTLSNFSIPAQITGASPVTITAPTSNSTGAFTYTSSNTAVATISGDVLTIVGAGSSTITATQAAAGSYGQGVITTVFTVSFAPPMTAAATPPALTSANVYALYSDAFTPLTGGNAIAINWNPGWGQSTLVSDVMISSNTTRKYENLNYQGVEFTPAINVSAFNKLHLDIWTPNCTEFKVFLINTAPLVEQSVTLTPTLSGWNSFDIDLSLFRNIQAVNLSSVNQMKFEAQPFGTSTVYMDNLYFYNSIGLPIKLKSFKAAANRNIVNLNWTTVTETNNKGFAIEKSIDGINFNQIGFVNGNNNSSVERSYSSIDQNPVTGNNYYRLKQIDLNGAFEYSTIEVVKFAKSKIAEVSFYPNPVKQNLQVNVSEVNTNNAVVNIINNLGQIVITKTVPKTSGNSILNLNLAALNDGVYYLHLIDGKDKTIEKFVISKN
jgi:hypothetical protein